MAPTVEQNPVTGVKEPYFPEKARLSRMFTGSMVIILMVSLICGVMGGSWSPSECCWFCSQLCVVIIFLVTVVMCRGIISVMMYHTGSPVLRTEVRPGTAGGGCWC